MNCNKIKEIHIPNSVKEIKSEAFKGCINLKKINIPENVQKIDILAFLNCKKLEKINVNKNNKYFLSISDVLYTKNKKVLLFYPNGKKDYKFTIPKSVKKINNYAFENNNKLLYITLNQTLEEICEGAFYRCNGISNIDLPDNIKSIEAYAFSSDIYSISYKGISYESEEFLRKTLDSNGVKTAHSFFQKIDSNGRIYIR